MARSMAVEYDRRILVKRAQMQALHNKYVRAMNAGKREIEKIAMEYFDKQAAYRKILAGVKRLRKG